MMDSEALLPCHCCGARIRDEEGSYIICDNCGWEDDPVQAAQPDFPGGANTLSLNRYKQVWQERKSQQSIRKSKLP